MKRIALEALVHEGQAIGLGLYARLLIEGLAKQQHNFNFILFDYLSRNFKERKNNLWTPDDPRFSLQLHWFPRPLMQFIEEKCGMKIQDMWLKQSDIDLYHGTRGILPPLSNNIKKIITVHDIGFIHHPEWYEDNPYYRFNKSCDEADIIVSDSTYTSSDLFNSCDVDPKKIRNVPLGVNPLFKTTNDHQQLEAITNKYKLPENFVLFVGGLRPVKNLPRILEGFAQFHKKGFKDWKLVLTGKKVYKIDEIDAVIQKYDLEEHIIFTGYIPTDDLVTLYNLASIFIFTTLYEGFGYPVLEAMSCSTPVLASNNSCLPETCGDAALLVSPEITEDISDGLEQLASDSTLRDKLIENGKNQILKFQWDSCIKKYIEIYDEVLKS